MVPSFPTLSAAVEWAIANDLVSFPNKDYPCSGHKGTGCPTPDEWLEWDRAEEQRLVALIASRQRTLDVTRQKIAHAEMTGDAGNADAE